MTKAMKARKSRASKAKPPRTKQRPRLLGLLPVPSEVADYVARETARLPMTKDARQWLENNKTLEYYYPDEWVICRKTDEGVEILAAGWDEVRRFLRKTPLSEHPGATMDLAETWE